MDKTYLIELVRDIGLFGTKETKITITEISSQNFGMKQERNSTLQVTTEIVTEIGYYLLIYIRTIYLILVHFI